MCGYPQLVTQVHVLNAEGLQGQDSNGGRTTRHSRQMDEALKRVEKMSGMCLGLNLTLHAVVHCIRRAVTDTVLILGADTSDNSLDGYQNYKYGIRQSQTHSQNVVACNLDLHSSA